MVESGVKIGRLGLKFGGAGVHHFERAPDAEFYAAAEHLLLFDAQQPGDLRVGVARFFQFAEKIFRYVFGHVVAQQSFLHFH